MNLKDKRTRRITAACASAAVVAAGGVTVGASFASATGSLSLTTGSSFNTLNLGQTLLASKQTLTTGVVLGAGETFTVTILGQATAALAKDTTSAQLETALNALSNVTAAGGVKVTDGGGGVDFQTSGHQFIVTFNVPGARAAITVADTHAGGANVAVAQTVTGSLNLPAAKLGDATFGTKVTSTPVGKLTLSFDSYTAPTGVTPTGTPALFYNHSQASNTNAGGGPQNNWVALFTPASATAVSTTLATSAADANDTFLTANLPGTYKFHFVDDSNTVGTDDDAVSPTVTMTVLDAEAATGATSDDWSPTVAVSKSTLDIGASVTATVPFSAVSTSDTRGASSGIGILGTGLAKIVGLQFDGNPTGAGTLDNDVAAYHTATAVTATSTAGTRTLLAGVTAHTGTLSATAKFDRNGDGTISDALGTAGTSTVQDNNVSVVKLDPTAVAAQVANGLVLDAGNHVVTTDVDKLAGAVALHLSAASAVDLTGHRLKISKAGEPTEYVTPTAGGATNNLTVPGLTYAHSAGSTVTDMTTVAIHNGNKTVNYSATVTDSDTDKSGNTVYFTLGGTDIADVTSGATLVSSTLTTKVYSVTTDKSGIAGLLVTDNATTPSSYTVGASSNGHAAATLTSKYSDPRASIVSITTTGAALSPAVSAGTVTDCRQAARPVRRQLRSGAEPQPADRRQWCRHCAPGPQRRNVQLRLHAVPAPTSGTTDTLTFAYNGEGNPTARRPSLGQQRPDQPPSRWTRRHQATAGGQGGRRPDGEEVHGHGTDSGSSGLAYKKVTLTAPRASTSRRTPPAPTWSTRSTSPPTPPGTTRLDAVFTRSGGNGHGRRARARSGEALTHGRQG